MPHIESPIIVGAGISGTGNVGEIAYFNSASNIQGIPGSTVDGSGNITIGGSIAMVIGPTTVFSVDTTGKQLVRQIVLDAVDHSVQDIFLSRRVVGANGATFSYTTVGNGEFFLSIFANAVIAAPFNLGDLEFEGLASDSSSVKYGRIQCVVSNSTVGATASRLFFYTQVGGAEVNNVVIDSSGMTITAGNLIVNSPGTFTVSGAILVAVNNTAINGKDSGNVTRNMVTISAGNKLILGDANLSAASIPMSVQPGAAATYDMGASSLTWRDGWFSRHMTVGDLQTAAPSGGTSGVWKLGIQVAAAITTNLSQYLQVDIGGTLYKLVTAN